MPIRLSLEQDPQLGFALGLREPTGPRTSRYRADLGAVRPLLPPPVRQALEGAPDQLRHRITKHLPNGAERRLPVLPLEGDVLASLAAALVTVAADGGEDDPEGVVVGLVEQRAPLPLGTEAEALPTLLPIVAARARAQEIVDARQVAPRLEESPAGVRAQWRPVADDVHPLVALIVDALARGAFADTSPMPGGNDRTATTGPAASTVDALGAELCAALGPQRALISADLPHRRRVERALEDMIRAARPQVQLQSTDNALVVRLHEPPLGTGWPLQTCLREPDGTVHPVADLRAVGDVSPAGAAEAAAEVLRLAPTVRTAQVEDTGVDWVLTTAQASAFLAHDTPSLELAGVTVLLPRQWTKQRARVRADAVDDQHSGEEKRPAGESVGLRAMASFRWSVAVGDVDLTEDEIAEIREAQSELVRLRGEWVRLDPGTLRAAERFLEAFSRRARQRWREDGPDGSGAAPGMPDAPAAQTSACPAEAVCAAGAAGADTPRLVPAQVEGAASWQEMLSLIGSEVAEDVEVQWGPEEGRDRPRGPVGLADLLRGDADLPTVGSPATLTATLRPYQQRGLDWMWFLHERGLGGILADDMGLGKTMQVLALLCTERERTTSTPIGPTLLVCPMSVVGSWQREAARWAPHLAVHVHHGGDRIRDDSFVEGAREVDLVLTTYALLDRDSEILRAVPWHRLVLDEAQHVKNPDTRVHQAARAIPSRHRLALTGTPVENRLRDLHSLMEVVNPGLLGPAARFQERIADPIEQESDPAAISRLRALTGPFLLRRVKTDRAIISDLPEKQEETTRVNLTPEQAGLYEAIVAEMMAQVDEADERQRRGVVVSALTKLKQVCNHPAHYLGDGSALLRDGAHRSGKLERIDDILETAFAEGEKVLLFTQFTAFGHMLLPYWEERFGLHVPFLHGGVPKAQRDAMVAQFQSTPDQPGAMLLSLRAGGTGLTLTAANHVIHIDRWWNPAVENQATDRAFRIGQRRNVLVRKLVSAGTVEERIDQVIAAKQDLATSAVGSGEGWIAGLDAEALRELLVLDRSEVQG
ncbi:DEAD/DEAH box helicase [Brachybacterium sp. EF45031]|uniref:DEAD/DEAH box helicase n=1 Tax=Brachybacterium sillae TaxID=2810536 RepID=UPI00217F0F42|nr:DEAD/DEAH box helicase [Brachybacterium sillae]MCS6711566.1 DEAD/DEAH box helicase [Brachybacterium sillae]